MENSGTTSTATDYFNDNKVKILKWGLVGLSIFLVYVYLWEKILAFAVGTLQIAIIGVILAVLFFTWPALCQAIATFGYRMWELAIRIDPIARLKQDEIASAREIDEYEGSISRADASIQRVKNVVKEQSKRLTPEDAEDYKEQIKFLEEAKVELVNRRDEMIHAHNDFVDAIARFEAKNQIANAFKDSLKAFSFNKKSGANSQGAKIAGDEVDKRLAESHAALKNIMSRPKPKAV